MSAAQDAFRATIEAGFYPEVDGQGRCYMCLALVDACSAGVITPHQLREAKDAIHQVLAGRFSYMATAVRGYTAARYLDDIAWAIACGVELYKNWDERSKTITLPDWSED